VADGARVTVKSRAGAVEVEASVTDAMMPGIVSLPHGFGHGAAKETLRVAGALGGPNVNVLTDVERIEPVIAQSILNGVPVELEAAAPASHRAPPSPLR
jgi:anaerobic selenocysteine-containing dehydrogenase